MNSPSVYICSHVSALVIALTFTSPAFGELFDNGTFTLDTATNLEWLDVMLTGNLSFDDVASGAGGFISDGWRHATGEEICDFFKRYAIDSSLIVCPTADLRIFTGPDNVEFLSAQIMNLLGTFFFQLSPITQQTVSTAGWFDDGQG